MTKWTPAQEQAIKQRGSVLVSASAGTGKTAVLTEKVVNSIITDGINIDDMVIMTFSAAAATQMKERIKNRIMEIIHSDEVDRNTRNLLWKQLRRFNNAHIQTIHSFCGELIRKYFYVIGMDPNVRVADTFDVAIIKNKIAKEVLDPEYQALDNDFITLEEMIDGTEDIENVIISSYDKIISFIDHIKWLGSAVEKYNIENEIPGFLKDLVLNDFKEADEKYKKAIDYLEQEGDKKTVKILDVLYVDKEIIESVIEGVQNSDPKYMGNLSSMLNDFGATVRFPADLNDIKALRNDARDIVTSYSKTNFDFRKHCERIKAMYPVMCKFRSIIERFDRKYTEEKRNRRVIDFNDMEKLAYEILKNDEISNECQNTYLRVFIDEYQDTNPIQEAIIERISSNNNLFCVGDLKQSIYRFRSSDPTLFLQRSKNYTTSTLGTIISLNNNFRSAQNILDCSNDVFDYITKISEEIDYTSNDSLIHGRNDDKAVTPVEIQIIPESFRGNDNLTLEEIEVYNIVKIINENIGQMIYDPEISETRPVEYKDITVLSRKLTGYTDYIAQIFTANNIPFVIERAGELFETMEVQILMNIISLINNPINDLALISLMHIGLFGFTDDDIIDISNKGIGYYQYMSKINDNSELSVKCMKMFSFFEDCRSKQKYLSLTAVLDYIISELKLNDVFAIMRNGEQKVANIKEFMKHAYDFEGKYGEKLYGFEKYLKNIIDAGVSVGEAILNCDENSVKVTTIHKSKGLEYPIVILAFTGKGFNKMDRRANVVIDKDGGIGVKYYNHGKKEKGRCILRSCIEDLIDAKNIEEEMRLLYVAMTRAKEKLYIQGCATEEKDYVNLEDSSCFLDWIMSTMANSIDFSERFGGKAEIKLTGKWNHRYVDYANIRPLLGSEANECELSEIINRFNVFSDIEYKKDDINKEYIPLVMSASLGNDSIHLNTPNFMKEKDPLYLGTVAHDFLHHADLSKCNSETGIEGQKALLEAQGVMSSDDIANVNTKNLNKFFSSWLGNMICTADKYTKEKYIGIIKDAKEIGYNANDDILVRCIIDLIFEKDGKTYLVDYKTDHLNNPSDDVEAYEKALTHKEQLDLYKESLANMYGIIIEKAYIAFINYGVSCEI